MRCGVACSQGMGMVNSQQLVKQQLVKQVKLNRPRTGQTQGQVWGKDTSLVDTPSKCKGCRIVCCCCCCETSTNEPQTNVNMYRMFVLLSALWWAHSVHSQQVGQLVGPAADDPRVLQGEQGFMPGGAIGNAYYGLLTVRHSFMATVNDVSQDDGMRDTGSLVAVQLLIRHQPQIALQRRDYGGKTYPWMFTHIDTGIWRGERWHVTQ